LVPWHIFPFVAFSLLAPLLKNWPLKKIFRGHFGPQEKFSGWNTGYGQLRLILTHEHLWLPVPVHLSRKKRKKQCWMHMIMTIQDCFLVAFNNHRSAALSDDLEKHRNCHVFLKVAKLEHKRKFELLRALRSAQVFKSIVREHKICFIQERDDHRLLVLKHVHFRGVARIFQRGAHTVSKWGYSPDCYVIFPNCCRLFA